MLFYVVKTLQLSQVHLNWVKTDLSNYVRLFLGTLPSIETIKKKWKSLTDSFRIHSKKDQAASGSAATSGKRPWVHLQRMQFLNDMRLESRYVCIIMMQV